MSPSFVEILILAILALLIFGPDRLPDIARSAGKLFRGFQREAGRAMSEFRSIGDELTSEVKSVSDEISAVGKDLTKVQDDVTRTLGAVDRPDGVPGSGASARPGSGASARPGGAPPAAPQPERGRAEFAGRGTAGGEADTPRPVSPTSAPLLPPATTGGQTAVARPDPSWPRPAPGGPVAGNGESPEVADAAEIAIPYEIRVLEDT